MNPSLGMFKIKMGLPNQVMTNRKTTLPSWSFLNSKLQDNRFYIIATATEIQAKLHLVVTYP